MLSPAISLAAAQAWVEPQASPAPKVVFNVALAQNKVAKKVANAPATASAIAKVAPSVPITYGAGLCANAPDLYECVKVESSQSWEKLFTDERERDLVQRVNRSYNYLYQGKVLSVPRDLKHVTIFDISPFPLKIKDEKEKLIIVDQDKLAWGAYDADGSLVNWGPIASGIDKCPDSARACRTLTGIYRVFSKEGEKCKSDIFPIGKGGAPMPYCMYFHKGFALHGSADMPGYRASHGCVRMFTRDAKWLNDNFVESTSEKNDLLGTKVVVRPVISTGKML